MTEEKKKIITREKHPGHAAQGHKLAALMKKRKEGILRSKERSSVQSSVQSTVQPTVQPAVKPTLQPTVQSTVQSSDTYVCGVVILAVFSTGVCIFFGYNRFHPKLINEKKDQPPQRLHVFKKSI